MINIEQVQSYLNQPVVVRLWDLNYFSGKLVDITPTRITLESSVGVKLPLPTPLLILPLTHAFYYDDVDGWIHNEFRLSIEIAMLQAGWQYGGKPLQGNGQQVTSYEDWSWEVERYFIPDYIQHPDTLIKQYGLHVWQVDSSWRCDTRTLATYGKTRGIAVCKWVAQYLGEILWTM